MGKGKISIFLLATQILFVNLGDALHRLPAFALHGDNSSVLDAPCNCCSLLMSSEQLASENGDWNPANEDCFLCKFFDRYVAADTSLDIALETTTLCQRRVRELSVSAGVTQVFYWSRGPPTLSV